MSIQEDYEWLRSLDPEIWDASSHPYAQPSLRRLTDDELERVFGLVVKHGLPCTVHNLNTSVGMAVYEKPVEAFYPGIEPADLRPPGLLFIPAKALPLSCAKKMDDRVLFDDAWDVFVRLTHTDENAKHLASCGLPKQESKGYYEY